MRFGAKIQKMTEDGYLKIVAIQNQKIMAQGSTEAQFGEIIQENLFLVLELALCLIATAIPDGTTSSVLEELRDNTVLQTKTNFMTGFNQSI